MPSFSFDLATESCILMPMSRPVFPASIFIEPPGILETAPLAIQKVFGAMRIRSRDPELPFKSRMSLVGEVVFNRVESGGHVDLEWVDHDAAVRNSYHWLVFNSSGGIQSDARIALVSTREFALYDGSSLPDELHLSGTSRNLIIMIPTALIPDELPRAMPVPADYGAGAILAAIARTMEAQAFSGESRSLVGFVAILIDALRQALSAEAGLRSVSLPRDARFARIVDHIELHLDDPQLNAASTARACGVSLRQLHRLFLASGETFAGMTRRLRLERAVVLLADRNRKISSISDDCGFSDASYFSTVFTGTYGETPRARRQRLLATQPN
jgi:AraC-like DNA-binding protein